MSYKPQIAYMVENFFNPEVALKDKLKVLSVAEIDLDKLIYFEESVEAFHPEYFIPHALIGQRVMKMTIINKMCELGMLEESKGMIALPGVIEKMTKGSFIQSI